MLAALPSPRGRALDVGCGTGRLLEELASRCEEVIGIDPDQPPCASRLGDSQATTTCSR